MTVFLILMFFAIFTAFGLYNYRSAKKQADALVEDIINSKKG